MSVSDESYNHAILLMTRNAEAYGMLQSAIKVAMMDLVSFPETRSRDAIAKALNEALARAAATADGRPDDEGRWTRQRGLHGAGPVYPVRKDQT